MLRSLLSADAPPHTHAPPQPTAKEEDEGNPPPDKYKVVDGVVENRQIHDHGVVEPLRT